MRVRITLNNGVIFESDNLANALKEMHFEASTNEEPTLPAVPATQSGAQSFLSWVSNRIYRRSHVDISISDPAKFLVGCVKHGWLQSIEFVRSTESANDDFDVWHIPEKIVLPEDESTS